MGFITAISCIAFPVLLSSFMETESVTVSTDSQSGSKVRRGLKTGSTVEKAVLLFTGDDDGFSQQRQERKGLWKTGILCERLAW